MLELLQTTVTFGKYKNTPLKKILKDRSYCKWLLQQDWFQNNYEYLYNRIKEYNPEIFFLNKYEGTSEEFIDTYKYFNLKNVENIELLLTENEKICYKYYLKIIEELKNKIKDRIFEENQYDIKAPTKWLLKFEKETNLKRKIFKDFLASYELVNIPYIVEDIKLKGGIDYKGARSFNIAKERSIKQELWWENILKEKYGEDLGTQFKYENCIFDFINIKTNTIFECKLGLKDFNEEQHKKYLLALQKYRIIYLIGYDSVIWMDKNIIYTTNIEKYKLYQCQILIMKSPSNFDLLIKDFNIIEVKKLNTIFGLN